MRSFIDEVSENSYINKQDFVSGINSAQLFDKNQEFLITKCRFLLALVEVFHARKVRDA